MPEMANSMLGVMGIWDGLFVRAAGPSISPAVQPQEVVPQVVVIRTPVARRYILIMAAVGHEWCRSARSSSSSRNTPSLRVLTLVIQGRLMPSSSQEFLLHILREVMDGHIALRMAEAEPPPGVTGAIAGAAGANVRALVLHQVGR